MLLYFNAKINFKTNHFLSFKVDKYLVGIKNLIFYFIKKDLKKVYSKK